MIDGGRKGRGKDSETKVPGSDAPEILVPQMMNSLPRPLLKACDGLGRFLHSMLGSVPSLRDDGTQQGVWPIPIPYPEAFRSLDSNQWRKRRLVLQIVALDCMVVFGEACSLSCLLADWSQVDCKTMASY